MYRLATIALCALSLLASSAAVARQTWRVVSTAPSAPSPNGLSFLNRDTGWIAGGGIVSQTFDGGVTWRERANGLEIPLTRLTFSSDSIGWACWSGVLKTTDAGATWRMLEGSTPERPGSSARFTPSACTFINDSIGWAVGDYMGIVKTVDGGATWSAQHIVWSSGSLPMSQFRLHDVQFLDSSTGWAVGGSPLRMVLRTTDGGATWLGDTDPTRLEVGSTLALSFVDHLRGWTIDRDGTLRSTTNGGLTWRTQRISEKSYLLSDIEFVDGSTGWIAGSLASGSTRNGVILGTTDGGATWSEQIVPGRGVVTLDFPDADNGYAITEEGVVLAYERTSSTPIGRDGERRAFALRSTPNPFQGSTTIAYSVPEADEVTVDIFDILGRHIGRLAAGRHRPGTHTVLFEEAGRTDASYLCVLRSGTTVRTSILRAIR